MDYVIVSPFHNMDVDGCIININYQQTGIGGEFNLISSRVVLLNTFNFITQLLLHYSIFQIYSPQEKKYLTQGKL